MATESKAQWFTLPPELRSMIIFSYLSLASPFAMDFWTLRRHHQKITHISHTFTHLDVVFALHKTKRDVNARQCRNNEERRRLQALVEGCCVSEVEGEGKEGKEARKVYAARVERLRKEELGDWVRVRHLCERIGRVEGLRVCAGISFMV